jgi:drug/metabolite transporter (DMT)-like permease
VPIVYLGLLVNVLAYFLYNYGLSRIPASRVSPYVNLIPVFSMLLGWLLLDERLTLTQYLAAGLVFGGTLAGHGRRV